MRENDTRVDIGFYQGVTLTIVLFGVFQLLYIIIDSPLQLVSSLFDKYEYTIYKFGRQLCIDTQVLILSIIKLTLVYLIIQKCAGISIRALLYPLPSLPQSLYWIFIGICLALFSSIMAWHSEIEDPAHIVWISTAIAIMISLMGPLQEEMVHRGILFSALLKKKRLLAYFISTIWFVWGHVPSYSKLFFNGILGIDLPHFILLVLMAILTAYIYESTRKLSLCVIFHSACNLTTVVSAFLNYCVEGV